MQLGRGHSEADVSSRDQRRCGVHGIGSQRRPRDGRRGRSDAGPGSRGGVTTQAVGTEEGPGDAHEYPEGEGGLF